ncbi:penicillin-binding protein [Burkholderia ubonensis]|uniref:peptidoglycan D,D-transpeptidase FtsI family protein n=1 Tax=Burkholderia ubonensis TaxID=101571 RepID=UPI0007527C72|nr:penicillin-binding protein 2 [Burkholderia ubonensis]KVR02164.1 penicillin-binding protein [Burkholderia ubonensis]KVU14912.1 penicillin-binding protein [Burkholderia ubonensis]KWO59162.1 penicillin-binding protein [Burkholderia ubonensis]
MTRSTTSFSRHRVIRDGLPGWRSRCVSTLFSVGFLVLAARTLWVQGIHPDFYIREGQKRYEHVFEVKPARGRILDRNGEPLAIGKPAADVWIVPTEFRSASNSEMTRLASMLGLQEGAIASRGNSERKFVFLKRGVEPEVALGVSQLGVPGVYVIGNDRRYYPGGSDFAQLIGWIGADGHGSEGVELADDALLSGSASKRRLIEDRLGRPVDMVGIDAAGAAGADLTLSIDRRIQHAARLAVEHTIDQFAAAAGSAVVVDARTGEMLALVNLPTFDPNVPMSAYDGRFRNRAIADVFEPGSTVKPITVALALTKGIVTPLTRFDTSPGRFNVFGSVIHDTDNFGNLSVTQIITKSSNIGMAKIAMQLSSQDMWGMFHSFGVGSPPLKALPAVANGTLHPARLWMPIEKLTMAYGYGLSMSLAQLADAYTVFANDGRRIPLSLMRVNTRPAGEPVVSSRVAQQIRAILEADGREGTARVASLPDYRTGGKTGTARKQSGHGYARGKYRAVFVGMAPMSDPRLIVAVMIDEPSRGSYYGARVAGPACAEIMESALHLLGVPPDRRSS